MIGDQKHLRVTSPDWGTTLVRLPRWQYGYSDDLFLLANP